MAKPDAAARQAIASLQYLTSLLESGADLDRVIDGYLETRRLLAKTFRDLAHAHLEPVNPVLDGVRTKVEQRMAQLFGGRVPPEYLTVRRYGTTHQLLAAYLFRQPGRPVPASRLRLLTGDQVHTERRVRELRDLGLSIEAGRVAGENQYILASQEPDLDRGAAIQLAQNIKSSDLDGAARSRLLTAVGLA
jgi:hypothetical protein